MVRTIAEQWLADTKQHQHVLEVGGRRYAATFHGNSVMLAGVSTEKQTQLTRMCCSCSPEADLSFSSFVSLFSCAWLDVSRVQWRLCLTIASR